MIQLTLLDERSDARIERGITLLDEKIPSWRGYINVNRLDMSSPRWSIEGQIGRHKFGIVDQWKASIHVLRLLELDTDDQDVSHALQAEADETYDELTEAWKRRLITDKENQ